jgi:hypothetical protein
MFAGQRSWERDCNALIDDVLTEQADVGGGFASGFLAG